MNRLFNVALTSATIRATGLALSLVVSAVMARTLAPDGYGAYSYVLSIVAILTVPTTFGLPTQIVRETARATAGGESSAVWALWAWALRLVLITVAVTLAAMLVWFFASVNTHSDNDGWLEWLWAALLIPALALASLRSAAISGLGNPLLGQVPDVVLRPALIAILALTLATFRGGHFSSQEALSINLTATVASLLVGTLILIWLAPPRPVNRVEMPERSVRRAWLLSTATFGFAVGAQTIGTNIDVMLLGLMRSNTEVGLYKISLNGASLVAFGVQSVNLVLMPRIATLFRAGASEELQTLVTNGTRIVLVLTFAVYGVFIIFGEWLLAVAFGPEFVPAYPTLLILGAGQVVSSTFSTVVLLLNMSGHERATLRGTMFFVFLNAILNILMIPRYGMVGAAVATAISINLFYLLLWYFAWDKTRISGFAFGAKWLTRNIHPH